MKTSNILFTTAILFFLSYLVIFDFGLKSQYHSIKKMGLANYEKAHRFDDFKKVKVGSFKNIDLKVSNLVNVRVEYGEQEAVYISNYLSGAIQIDNKANHLFVYINKNWKGNYFANQEFAVIIITKKIDKLTTSITLSKSEWEGHRNEISGFTQDSMAIYVSDLTKVDMNNNRIQSLDAKIGSGLAGGNFFVGANNKIESVKLDVKGRSSIEFQNAEIKNLERDLSDSSSVTLKGKVLKGIGNEVK
jgi:hypothetical protein